MGVWHYCVPSSRRRYMKELDKRYRQIVNENISKEKLSVQSNLNHNTNKENMV